MNAWLLPKFDALRRELLAAGEFREFCRELRALAAPDGGLSLYEVIDSTNPDEWAEAAGNVQRRTAQMALNPAAEE